MQRIVDRRITGLVMEYAAYGGVEKNFGLSPEASGRTKWRNYFSILRETLKEYKPTNASQVRDFWLTAYNGYLEEKELIVEIARYMMKEVYVIDEIRDLLSGEKTVSEKKTTLAAGFPLEVTEVVFAFMIPEYTDLLLAGLGFPDREVFLQARKDRELFADRPPLFTIEPCSRTQVEAGSKKKVLIFTGSGFKREDELSFSDLQLPEIPPIPSSGPLGRYLEYLWNGGSGALVMSNGEAVKGAGKGRNVKIVYEETVYLGDPITFDGTGLELADSSIFINIHLPTISFVSKDNFSSVVTAFKLTRKCLCDLAHQISTDTSEASLVVAASNSKLVGILQKLGFTIVDYLPEGERSKMIRQDAAVHDHLLGERINSFPCPVAVMPVADFVQRFHQPQKTFTTEASRIKELVVNEEGEEI